MCILENISNLEGERMKKWFENLGTTERKKVLTILWIATIVILFVFGVAPEDSFFSNLLAWIWIASLVFSIVFTVWTVKLKNSGNSNTANNTRSQQTEARQTISTKPVDAPLVKPESEKNYDLFDKCVDNYYLAYEYEEKITFPKVDVITGKGGKKIEFKQEPDSEYDNKAVALYLEENKIGYLYRDRTQDMVNDWIKKNDYFWGYINKIDVAKSSATFKIGFYKDITSLEMKSFKLTKITKRAPEYESSRFENLECCSDGDVVLYESSYETDNYIVTNEYGSELGELGAKAVEWIEENEGDIKIVRINNIEETDSGSLKADIEFYYR
jgi:hypothetical protein